MNVLSGYRVLDLSIAMSGPIAAARLGDLGADVVKVEPVTGNGSGCWNGRTAGVEATIRRSRRGGLSP
jgi:crotonobetainyl-CoA:carnitine CoA-transferase CaiB-like acyl-CoA transferase